MKLVVMIVLAYAAATSAQIGFGAVGSKVGSKVGADIGLFTGTVFDTVPSVIGYGTQPDPPPRRGPLRRKRPRGGGESGSEYAEGSENVREKTVVERERGTSYDTGRSKQGERRRRPYPNSN